MSPSAQPKAMLATGMFALLAWTGASFAAPQVHDGMTKHQLAEFAERQGWQPETAGAGNFVTIRAGDESVHIVMLDCDAGGLCRSGLIRHQSYYFLRSPGGACNFWHWNYDVKGATGFGPDYVTLQRYLHFRGVTDQYLKEVIDAFVAASPSFWKLVEDCAGLDRPQQAE